MSDDPFFGDIEPEDSWDANDPIVVMLRNLRRRLIAILTSDADGPIAARIRQRLEMIRDDLDTIRERIVGND